MTVFWELTENDGSTGGMSQELIDRMLALGGDWYNTEYGFESSDHIALGYNGSYLSLNTLIDGFIDIPEVVLNGDSSSWGSQMFGHITSFMAQWNSTQGDMITNAWNGNFPRSATVDAIIKNDHYNLVSLGLDQAVAKSGSYLTKALQTKSTVNFTVLNKYTKPAFRTKVAGSMLSTSKVANVAKGLKDYYDIHKQKPKFFRFF